MAIVVSLLCFVVVVTLAESGSHGALKIDELSLQLVAGSFVQTIDKTTIGIRFISTPDTLLVENLQGVVLLRADESVGEGKLRLFEIGSDQFIQQKLDENGEQKTLDWVVPKSRPIKTQESAENKQQKLSLSIDRVSEIGRKIHEDLLVDRINNLILEKEIHLMKLAADAMGSKGVIGIDYPSILPFYLSTLQLEKLRHTQPGTSNSTIVQGVYQTHSRSRRGACFSTCPPCPNNDCFGLCGYGCYCWDFLCGNCCYHLGCQGHDVCCRESFYGSSCLFPYSFRCESPYSC